MKLQSNLAVTSAIFFSLIGKRGTNGTFSLEAFLIALGGLAIVIGIIAFIYHLTKE